MHGIIKTAVLAIGIILAPASRVGAEERKANVLGPIVGMFCDTEKEIRHAIRLHEFGTPWWQAVQILRERYGIASCSFRRFLTVSVLAVHTPERKLFSGRILIVHVITPPFNFPKYTFIASEISEEAL